MKLLMYYDGKDYMAKTLDAVKTRAKALKAKVHVLSSHSNPDGLSADTVCEMENGLHYVKSALESENIPCDTHILVVGRTPDEDIIDVANEYQVDEIIIGTDRVLKAGKSKTGRLINCVNRRARCPVLIV